ncbi:MAG: EboA domain-containing protein [Salinivenus sp.]
MDRSQVIALLNRWVEEVASDDGLEWLREQRAEIAGGAPRRVFYTSFSAVPRYIDKHELELSAADRAAADEARTGWKPAGWSATQAGRTLIVLSLPHEDREAYLETLDRVFTHADVGESVALYQALPLLPYPESHRDRAAEGVRSNMTSVLEAVAHRNPYPAEHFEDPAWNQMVLKLLFEDSSLYPVYRLDERANPTLARMLIDYVHERWAADRSVPPELWRLVGPFAEDEALDDLERALREGPPAVREAAALALSQSPTNRAETLLRDEAPELQEAIESGSLTWAHLREERLEPMS